VHFPEGLHGQKEDQFEMGHPALDGPAVEGGDKTLAGGWHDVHFFTLEKLRFSNVKK
jgi:hypothetical protein